MIWRSRHIGIGIERPFEAVSDFLAVPENFPKWAEGLGGSFEPAGGLDYRLETPTGSARVRFSPPNPYGIADHTVFISEAEPILNPLRAMPNDTGSEVVFTLFQRPGMSNEDFERDAAWVAKDLKTLKALLESE
ncbi:polyketide cyclase [Kaistia algarum]|uniref:polyketide cyclase n=1 Tax=Kaistia algarum TaxID=2083279 RepID=UPI000CE7D6F8|nr:polyketide cyclase [Kaistia algarum]MCX5515254.1 SRPBCC family protein [Kaistia algarum]PPE79962.1 polyketide cyclase [Kaistia algarum]